MQVLKEYLGFSATALNLRERRNNIIGSNIANAATPNYKARDINFEQILKAKEGIQASAILLLPVRAPVASCNSANP